MKTRTIAVLGAAIAVAVLGAAPASAHNDRCNWGQLTVTGVPLGEHSSAFAGERRVGLANVIAPHDLNALCEALSGP